LRVRQQISKTNILWKSCTFLFWVSWSARFSLDKFPQMWITQILIFRSAFSIILLHLPTAYINFPVSSSNRQWLRQSPILWIKNKMKIVGMSNWVNIIYQDRKNGYLLGFALVTCPPNNSSNSNWLVFSGKIFTIISNIRADSITSPWWLAKLINQTRWFWAECCANTFDKTSF